MKKVRLSFVVFALLLLSVGCAKPPDAEMQAAKTAMDAAVSAGADKYAPADFDGAKKIWDTAESQMKEKKYKEAKQSYMDAKAAFEKASASAQAGKKAAADEANTSLTAVEESWKNLQDTASKMEKKLKDKKEAWETDAKAIDEGIGKAKEMVATDPAGAKAKLDEVKGMMDKWDNTFKEMAAAPAKPEAPTKKR